MLQAIILAGGFGTRLKSIVNDLPKPMAKIKNLPFLSYILTHLKTCGINDVVMSVGYMHEKIIDFFGNSYLGINIRYAIENEPLGTGGAIFHSLNLIDQKYPVAILNGDTFLNIDYQKLFQEFREFDQDLAIVLRHVEDTSRYGVIELNDKNIILSFLEKNISNNSLSGLINAGVYVLKPDIATNFVLPKSFSFEKDFLCKHIKEIKARGIISDNYFIDIGIPDDYLKSQSEIPEIVKNKALFLDRDGVINHDYGYVHSIENFHFIEGIFDLCKVAFDSGYLIIIVTNQSGIARGYYSEEQFLNLTKWMEERFLENGIKISKTYYCPFHKDALIEKYKHDSFDRKPNPGMLFKAIEEFNIDPKKSILIGDQESDIEAAKKVGIYTKFLFNGAFTI